uniref:APC membrane recruitment protein 1 n=1 Tax=Hippocampus comes TaxID=109280 RepID=A0A3Q2XR44_HIPCM
MDEEATHVNHTHLPDKATSIEKAPKSGKFRTALTFFGVRKSMCLLPSFFGGRSKNQSKWTSKKGIYKSKTHDGLSQISHDDSPRGASTSTGDFECLNQSDCTENLHCNECSFPNEQKSQSLTRQKRGLKSFFSSFKHHKNHRNGSDKTEMIAMSSPHCPKAMPPVQSNPDQYVTQCLESEPDVPDFANAMCDSSLAPECNITEVVTLEKSCDQENTPIECDTQACLDQIDEINLMAVVSSEYKESGRGQSEPCLLLDMMPDPTLKSETPAGSSDQLNMIYGEVASLKSFDSLTGCGDIIADQEVDSITETPVSGERSRNGGKRASCFLTFQGGGEEMASPEDFDEPCLHDFWENNASEELHCPCNQDYMDVTGSIIPSHNMDSEQQASTSNTSADVLTPQSEHQESVPNSDEGYYDSTTPGPDEGQDRTDRLRQTNRLPRDSYSGDALYELFATDESLVSPHHESKPRLPSTKQTEQMDGTELASPTTINVDCKTRHSNLSFANPSDPDFKTLCDPKELHPEENKPVALPFGNVGSHSPDCNSCLDESHTVCFSQALVNYEKNSQLLCNLHNASVDVLETSTTFTPNMEALPTIVTFDVVDTHNEGEYEEQIHMELEEDISSPYQEFEDSYLQKDAFAECDYQMLDLYEQSLISNTWAIASLPRHLGLTRLSQSMSNPLSLDRRSRSLDTESLQTSLELLRNIFSDSFSAGLPDGEAHLHSDVPMSCDVMSPDAELYSRPCHLPLPSDSCLPHSTFVYSGIDTSYGSDEDTFRKTAADWQSYMQFGQSGQTVNMDRMSHFGSPRRAGVPTEDPHIDATNPAASNKLPKMTLKLKGSQ